MSDLTVQILRALTGAFFGTVGFAMLIHVPKRSWFPSGIIAALAYLVYWVLNRLNIPDSIAVFTGALFGSLTGLICARKLKLIGTIFLMSAVVPVVPGLGLYRMMAAIGQGQIYEGTKTGVGAMITVAMIALGLVTGAFTDRFVWSGKAKHDIKQTDGINKKYI